MNPGSCIQISVTTNLTEELAQHRSHIYWLNLRSWRQPLGSLKLQSGSCSPGQKPANTGLSRTLPAPTSPSIQIPFWYLVKHIRRHVGRHTSADLHWKGTKSVLKKNQSIARAKKSLRLKRASCLSSTAMRNSNFISNVSQNTCRPSIT